MDSFYRRDSPLAVVPMLADEAAYPLVTNVLIFLLNIGDNSRLVMEFYLKTGLGVIKLLLRGREDYKLP